MSERAPHAEEQLSRIYSTALSLKDFLDRECRSGVGGQLLIPVFELEGRIEPLIRDLAEALAQARPDEWYDLGDRALEVKRAVQKIGAVLDDLIARWEWGRVLGPDGESYVAGMVKQFKDNVERPYHEALVSWRRDLDLPPNPEVDREAARLRRLGVEPTMSPSEAAEVVGKREMAYRNTPVRGPKLPLCGGDSIAALEGAIRDLGRASPAVDDRRRTALSETGRPGRNLLIMWVACGAEDVGRIAAAAEAALKGLEVARDRMKVWGRGIALNQAAFAVPFDPVWPLMELLKECGMDFERGYAERALGLGPEAQGLPSSTRLNLQAIYLDLHHLLSYIEDEGHKPTGQYPNIDDQFIARFADVVSRLRRVHGDLGDASDTSPLPLHSPPAQASSQEATASKPTWDREGLKLRLGEIVCKAFRADAHRQITLIQAFEDEGWPGVVKDPFRDPDALAQVIKDLNKGTKSSPIGFRVEGRKARWHHRSTR